MPVRPFARKTGVLHLQVLVDPAPSNQRPSVVKKNLNRAPPGDPAKDDQTFLQHPEEGVVREIGIPPVEVKFSSSSLRTLISSEIAPDWSSCLVGPSSSLILASTARNKVVRLAPSNFRSRTTSAVLTISAYFPASMMTIVFIQSLPKMQGHPLHLLPKWSVARTDISHPSSPRMNLRAVLNFDGCVHNFFML